MKQWKFLSDFLNLALRVKFCEKYFSSYVFFIFILGKCPMLGISNIWQLEGLDNYEVLSSFMLLAVSVLRLI
jgi:hypothetical protein